MSIGETLKRYIVLAIEHGSNGRVNATMHKELDTMCDEVDRLAARVTQQEKELEELRRLTAIARPLPTYDAPVYHD